MTFFQKGIKKDTVEEAYFIIEKEYEENTEERKLKKRLREIRERKE